jgi:Zn-finger protein
MEIIIGLVIVVLVIIIIAFLTQGYPCQSCGEKTTSEDKDGKPLCDDCHQIKQAEATEKIVHCPHDNSKMSKKIVEGITIDKCPKCHGVWLDSDELDKITESIDDNSDSGHGSGLATGLVIGMAMN